MIDKNNILSGINVFCWKKRSIFISVREKDIYVHREKTGTFLGRNVADKWRLAIEDGSYEGRQSRILLKQVRLLTFWLLNMLIFPDRGLELNHFEQQNRTFQPTRYSYFVISSSISSWVRYAHIPMSTGLAWSGNDPLFPMNMRKAYVQQKNWNDTRLYTPAYTQLYQTSNIDECFDAKPLCLLN